MSADRIVSWAAALLICVPGVAIAQDTEPPDETPIEETEEAEEVEEATSEPDPDSRDSTPIGTPETVETEEPEPPPATPEPPSAPERVVEKQVIEKTEVVTAKSRPRVSSEWNRAQAAKRGKNYLWFLTIGGYVRAGYTGIEDDPAGTFGNHDGFVIGNARLSLKGRLSSLGFKLQFDGAVDRNDDANDPNAEVVTRLKDANIFWQPVKPVRLTVGQFKPPFDVEEQFSTSEIPFVDRSVASRGVKNVEGRNVRGLSTAREVGVELGTDHWHFLADGDELEGPGISYGLAVTNGQDANKALNDNDKLAGYGRLELHWADLVTVGGAYFFNDRTIGIAPDTLDEKRTGWTADLTFTGFGFTVIGGVIGESTTRPDLEGIEPETTGFGYQGQLAYREPFFGFQPAFRYAYFDPTELAGSTDELTYITFGLNYVPDYPIKLLLNYTIAQENEEFELPNNRFDGVLQVTW